MSADNEKDEQHREDQHHVEGQQDRVIERQQQHADQRLQAIGQPVQQQGGAAFLHGHDVKEPVDQLRRIALIEGFQ